jgi:hypothetical protein
MSYRRGLAAVNLERTDKVAQVEWLGGMSRAALEEITGIDAMRDTKGAFRRMIEVADLDLNWGGLPNEPGVMFEGGEASKSGEDGGIYTEWGIFGSGWSEGGARARVEGIRGIEDVLSYEPLADHPETVEELAEGYQRDFDSAVRDVGGLALVGGSFYHTLFHWCISKFGWESFLEAAATERRRFDGLLGRFAEVSARVMEAWSRVKGLEVFISHDDICMTRGPVFHPEWYREHVFPRYRKLWEPLKAKGIKIIFCSDGNITEIAEDVAEAGADGFIFEPLADLGWMVERFGKKKILIGGISTRTLTFGSEEDVEAEVQRAIEIAGDCAGYFLNAGGQITHNIPMANLRRYWEAAARWRGGKGGR